MGHNLSRTPLMALLHAALLVFVGLIIPISSGYVAALHSFSMPLYGYLLLVVYGLWLSLLLGLLFHYARVSGFKLWALATVCLVGITCFQPVLEQLIYGVPTGVVTKGDTMMEVVAGGVSALLLLVLAALLLKTGEGNNEKPGTRYKLGPLPLIIRLVVCPLSYCLLYVLTWYFLGWKNAAVRLYYNNGAETLDEGFMRELIKLLWDNAGLLGFALLQGLLLVLLSLPLLLLVPGKRFVYMGLNTMLYLTSALYWLIPSPIYTDALRFGQFWRFLVLMLLYAAFTGIMLHTAMKKEEPEAPPRSAEAPGQGGRGAPPRRPVARR